MWEVSCSPHQMGASRSQPDTPRLRRQVLPEEQVFVSAAGRDHLSELRVAAGPADLTAGQNVKLPAAVQRGRLLFLHSAIRYLPGIRGLVLHL